MKELNIKIKKLKHNPWTSTISTSVKVKIGNFTCKRTTLSIFWCYGIMIVFCEEVVSKFMKIYVNFGDVNYV